MAVEHAIEVTNLHKSYGRLHVLRGVDLAVARGEAFGLLGRNGAGKSTLIHTILGLLLPDQGTIKVLGNSDIAQSATRIGYLPERPRYHAQFTGREYLGLLGRLSDLGGLKLHERIDAVLELVDMQDAADRRIGTYSKGMLQRIGLAQALLHEPDMLIADEPGSGLDPAGQRDMAQLLRRIGESGRTVFLCTHHLSEVTQLCDRVGVLTQGRLDQVVTLRELQERGHSVTIKVHDLPAETARVLAAMDATIRSTRTEVVLFPATHERQAAVLRALLDDDVAIISVTPEANALEQFYLNAIRDDDHPTGDVPPPPTPLEERFIEVLMNGKDR
jgi:ABC-2 type transport system ATP-binding protein